MVTANREVEKREPVRGVALPAGMHSHEHGHEEPEARRVEGVSASEFYNVDDEVQGESENAEQAVANTPTHGLTPPKSADPSLPPAVREAIDRANMESQTLGGKPGPAAQTPGSARRAITTQKLPMIQNVDEMSREQMIELIQQLAAQRRVGVPIQKALRWNNGAEPNISDNGELISARDTGTISVYGFGRRPVTFYAGQWIQLAHYMPDILHFIANNREAMNEYVEQRLGNKSKELSKEEVDGALSLFVGEQEESTEKAESVSS